MESGVDEPLYVRLGHRLSSSPAFQLCHSRGSPSATHSPLVGIGPDFDARSSTSLLTALRRFLRRLRRTQGPLDSFVHLLLRVEKSRSERGDDLHLYASVLTSAAWLTDRVARTLHSAPTISGILMLATLPEEIMTTRRIPSGISGLCRALSNGVAGFILLPLSCGVDASASRSMFGAIVTLRLSLGCLCQRKQNCSSRLSARMNAMTGVCW